MTDFLQRNLALVEPGVAAPVLEAVPPPEAVPSRSRRGAWTLSLAGVSLHSRVDPLAEAATLAGSEKIRDMRARGVKPAVFGLGLGYHVLALAELFPELTVIEPRPWMIRLAFSLVDLTGVLERLRLVLGPNDLAAPWPGAELITHAASARINREEYLQWREFFNAGAAADLSPDRLERAWGNIPGFELIRSEPAFREPRDPGALVLAIRARPGPPTELETLVLLMEELLSP
ncbi:MAG: hypothetical protein V1816_28535 [Pseudomonadota bacterium]